MTIRYVIVEDRGEYDERYQRPLLWTFDKALAYKTLFELKKISSIGMAEDKLRGYWAAYQAAGMQRLAAYGALLGEAKARNLDPNCGWYLHELEEIEPC